MKWKKILFIFVFYNNFFTHNIKFLKELSSKCFINCLKNLNTINGLDNINEQLKDQRIFTAYRVCNTMICVQEKTQNNTQYVNYHRMIKIIIFSNDIIMNAFTYNFYALRYPVKRKIVFISRFLPVIILMAIIANVVYTNNFISATAFIIIIIYCIKKNKGDTLLVLNGINLLYFSICSIQWICMDNLDMNSLALLLVGITIFNLLSSSLLWIPDKKTVSVSVKSQKKDEQNIKVSKIFYLLFTIIQIMFFSFLIYYDYSFYITLLFQIILVILFMNITSKDSSNLL